MFSMSLMALNVGIFSFESTFTSSAKNTPMCNSVPYMPLMRKKEISNTFLIIINLGCLDRRDASFFIYLQSFFFFPSAVRNSTIRRFHATSSLSEQIRNPSFNILWQTEDKKNNTSPFIQSFPLRRYTCPAIFHNSKSKAIWGNKTVCNDLDEPKKDMSLLSSVATRKMTRKAVNVNMLRTKSTNVSAHKSLTRKWVVVHNDLAYLSCATRLLLPNQELDTSSQVRLLIWSIARIETPLERAWTEMLKVIHLCLIVVPCFIRVESVAGKETIPHFCFSEYKKARPIKIVEFTLTSRLEQRLK